MIKQKLSSSNRGFTLVELMIILVSLGIIVAIIYHTYSGIQNQSINTKKETAIRTLQESIEKFYSKNMYYPSLANINSSAWRNINMPGLTNTMLKDPTWTTKNTLCNLEGKAILLSTPQPGCYGYSPTNNGASCANSDKTCSEYTLSAILEGNKGLYTLHQLD